MRSEINWRFYYQNLFMLVAIASSHFTQSERAWLETKAALLMLAEEARIA